MITPTVGRIVWYKPTPQDRERGMDTNGDEPLAAVVAAVLAPTVVNLGVFDATGALHVRQRVDLVQPEDPEPEEGGYCGWMPYQVEQAAKVAAPASKRAKVAADD